MRLQTAAQVVDLAKRLGRQSAAFYANLAEADVDHRELFQAYSRQDSRSTKQIEQTYCHVVSDVLETGFTFDLEEDDYTLPIAQEEAAGLTDRIGRAKKIEEIVVRFLREAASQSESLMADLPGLFRSLARKRMRRLTDLAELARASARPDG
jgi:hypothetical protein